ncbi:MAG: hypothetical protein AAB668_01795 [Patescibacteria group bacterium]
MIEEAIMHVDPMDEDMSEGASAMGSDLDDEDEDEEVEAGEQA